MDKIVIKKSQNSLLRPLGWFFRRFHLLLFFIFIVVCLGVAVIMINDTLTNSSNQEFTSNITAGSIDQTTLDKIQLLHSSGQPGQPVALPEGRVNPFSE